MLIRFERGPEEPRAHRLRDVAAQGSAASVDDDPAGPRGKEWWVMVMKPEWKPKSIYVVIGDTIHEYDGPYDVPAVSDRDRVIWKRSLARFEGEDNVDGPERAHKIVAMRGSAEQEPRSILSHHRAAIILIHGDVAQDHHRYCFDLKMLASDQMIQNIKKYGVSFLPDEVPTWLGIRKGKKWLMLVGSRCLFQAYAAAAAVLTPPPGKVN